MTISFYELVRVVDSERTRSLTIANRRGVVVGLPPHLIGIADDPLLIGEDQGQYAIDIDGMGYALFRSEFVPVGQVLSREAFDSGESGEPS